MSSTPRKRRIMASSPAEVAIDTALATQIVCGEHISAVVTDDGDLYMFGREDTLQLGRGEDEGEAKASRATSGPVPVPSLCGRVVAVALGADHVCAIDTTGSLFSFGRGSFSQLGLGDTVDRASPTRVDGLSSAVVSVACGWRFTLAVCTGGDVFSWGAGSTGQLGHPSKLRRRVPTKIEALAPDRLNGSHITSVSAGEIHSMALDDAGAVYMWGCNQNGRLGLGEVDSWGKERTTPTVLSSMSACAVISAGNRHSACVTRSGVLYTWGCNADGRLGIRTTVDACTPQRVSLPGKPKVATVSCGVAHTLALSAAGRIFSWGCGKSGRLGMSSRDGSAESKHENRDAPAPVVVQADPQMRFVNVAAGSNHNLAVCDSGRVMAWGALISVSNKGQLGLKAEQSEYAEEEEFAAFGEDVETATHPKMRRRMTMALSRRKLRLLSKQHQSPCEEGAPRTTRS